MKSTRQPNADESGSNTVIELDESDLPQVAGDADVISVIYGTATFAVRPSQAAVTYLPPALPTQPAAARSQ